MLQRSILSIAIYLIAAGQVLCDQRPVKSFVYQINNKKPINVVSEKFLSFTVDPITVLHAADCQSSNATTSMIKGLLPAYLRVAGPDSDRFVFKTSSDFSPSSDSKSKNLVLSGNQWNKFYEFISASGLNLIVCLNGGLFNERIDTKDLSSALEFINFSNSNGFNINWQLGYELQKVSHDDGKDAGQEVVKLRNILEVFPHYQKSLIVGPDMTNLDSRENVVFLRNYLIQAQNSLNAFTIHPNFAAIPDKDLYDRLLNTFFKMDTYLWQKEGVFNIASKGVVPKKPVWIAESENKETVGQFSDSMSFIKRLGFAAKLGASVYLRKPHLMSLYEPTSEYWTSSLFKALVGRSVLDMKLSNGNSSKLFAFSHCTQILEKPEDSIINPTLAYERGSVTVYGVNAESEPSQLAFKAGIKTEETIHLYVLTEDSKNGLGKTLLNRQLLGLSADNDLPMVTPKIRESTSFVVVPPHSIFFLVFPNMKCRACVLQPPVDNEDDIKTKSKHPTATEEEESVANPELPISGISKSDLEDSEDESAVYVSYPKKSERIKAAHDRLERLTAAEDNRDIRPTPELESDYHARSHVGPKFITFTDDTWLSAFPDKMKEIEEQPTEDEALDTSSAARRDRRAKIEKYRIMAQAMLGRRNVTTNSSPRQGEETGHLETSEDVGHNVARLKRLPRSSPPADSSPIATHLDSVEDSRLSTLSPNKRPIYTNGWQKPVEIFVLSDTENHHRRRRDAEEVGSSAKPEEKKGSSETETPMSPAPDAEEIKATSPISETAIVHANGNTGNSQASMSTSTETVPDNLSLDMTNLSPSIKPENEALLEEITNAVRQNRGIDNERVDLSNLSTEPSNERCQHTPITFEPVSRPFVAWSTRLSRIRPKSVEESKFGKLRLMRNVTSSDILLDDSSFKSTEAGSVRSVVDIGETHVAKMSVFHPEDAKNEACSNLTGSVDNPVGTTNETFSSAIPSAATDIRDESPKTENGTAESKVSPTSCLGITPPPMVKMSIPTPEEQLLQHSEADGNEPISTAKNASGRSADIQSDEHNIRKGNIAAGRHHFGSALPTTAHSEHSHHNGNVPDVHLGTHTRPEEDELAKPSTRRPVRTSKLRPDASREHHPPTTEVNQSLDTRRAKIQELINAHKAKLAEAKKKMQEKAAAAANKKSHGQTRGKRETTADETSRVEPTDLLITVKKNAEAPTQARRTKVHRPPHFQKGVTLPAHTTPANRSVKPPRRPTDGRRRTTHAPKTGAIAAAIAEKRKSLAKERANRFRSHHRMVAKRDIWDDAVTTIEDVSRDVKKTIAPAEKWLEDRVKDVKKELAEIRLEKRDAEKLGESAPEHRQKIRRKLAEKLNGHRIGEKHSRPHVEAWGAGGLPGKFGENEKGEVSKVSFLAPATGHAKPEVKRHRRVDQRRRSPVNEIKLRARAVRAAPKILEKSTSKTNPTLTNEVFPVDENVGSPAAVTDWKNQEFLLSQLSTTSSPTAKKSHSFGARNADDAK